MRICDVCKDTDQDDVALSKVEMFIDGESWVLVDEVCPTCIERAKLVLKPRQKPNFQHRDMGGPESLYRGNDL